MFLLDTNAVSEIIKKRPNQGYMDWFNVITQDQLTISCFVLGELHKGIELAEPGLHRQRLKAFVANITRTFTYTTFSFDSSTAQLWGKLLADAQTAGKTPQIIDSFIAAQCIQNNLVLVTRNSKDFEQFEGLEIFNPWS